MREAQASKNETESFSKGTASKGASDYLKMRTTKAKL